MCAECELPYKTITNTANDAHVPRDRPGKYNFKEKKMK